MRIYTDPPFADNVNVYHVGEATSVALRINSDERAVVIMDAGAARLVGLALLDYAKRCQ